MIIQKFQINDKYIAEYALGEIQKPYGIERKCKEERLLPEEIKTRRQEQSCPILKSLSANG